jgi:hypothetical protein
MYVPTSYIFELSITIESTAMASAAAAPPPAGASDGAAQEVFLPPTYVLRTDHVEDALKGVPADARNVTVWIHSSTLGIEKECFDEKEFVSRILVWGAEPHDVCAPLHVDAAVLGMLIGMLRAYEPDLVDTILGFVTHNDDDEMYRVGEDAFRSCSALREVVLPRSITHVGEYVFYECTSLTSVTLPDSLTHLGEWAFHKCTSLTSVTFPNSLTYIGDYAFQVCTSLTSVTLPDSLTHVGEWAFNGCTSLTSVTLPASLTHIGKYAFVGCTSLAQVNMPPVRPVIGERAFEGCPWTWPK